MMYDLATLNLDPAADTDPNPEAAHRSNYPATATPKQQKFIESLLEGRETAGTPYAGWTPNWAKSTPRTASAVIDALLAMPHKAQAPRAAQPSSTAAGLPVLKTARYALRDDEGAVKFYRVDMPQEGKWAGRTFVKVQASDDYWPVRGAAADLVLSLIGADPQAAATLYGHELGACALCGRTLTDEDSRARGIGPVCAEKVGW